MLIGALEAGGTKMVLGIADADGRILHSHSLPTRTPNETVPEMIAFFSQHAICALGVATFGPAQVHADSPERAEIDLPRSDNLVDCPTDQNRHEQRSCHTRKRQQEAQHHQMLLPFEFSEHPPERFCRGGIPVHLASSFLN